jgi:hypothetical protein
MLADRMRAALSAARGYGLSGSARDDLLARVVGDGNHVVRANPTFLREVANVTAAVGPRTAFPAFLLFVLVAFVAIQDRIDRRDPKLALAPISDEPYLSFDPETGSGPQ